MSQLLPSANAALEQVPIDRLWQLLLAAHEMAESENADPWQFAVEMSQLEKLGIATTTIRWLISEGYVRHGKEVTRPRDPRRRFQPVRNWRLCSDTCFVLTESGVALAREILKATPKFDTLDRLEATLSYRADRLLASAAATAAPQRTAFLAGEAGGVRSRGRTVRRPRPIWDAERFELRVGEVVVRRLDCRATNQILILAVFQEEHWPQRIDDPLAPTPNTDPKHRLRATVHSLNCHQAVRLLRFQTDGTGTGVLWRWADTAHPSTNA